jgi:hypothetical protein
MTRAERNWLYGGIAVYRYAEGCFLGLVSTFPETARP